MVSEIEEFRRKIDQIDQDILELLSKRLSLVKEIGDIKHREGVSIYQPERIKKVISSRCQWGKAKAIRTDLVRELFECLIRYSMEEEKR